MHAAVVGKQARPEDACMKMCFIYFCKQGDQSCVRYVLSMLHALCCRC